MGRVLLPGTQKCKAGGREREEDYCLGRENASRAVHAEANALLNCAREQTINADLYLSGVNPNDNSVHKAKPCPLCARMIIQAGIRNVYLRTGPNAGDYTVVPAKELNWVVKE